MLIYSESAQQQFDYLLTTCLAQNVVGGALEGVDIQPVAPPDYPQAAGASALGMQWSRWSERSGGTGIILQTNFFELHLVAVYEFSPNQTDAPKQVKLAIEKLWNDRNGHGLGPVLRADRTLGGTAIDSYVADAQLAVGRGVEEESRSSGVVLVTFAATAELRLWS